MCGRRLAKTFTGSEKSHDPVHRSRLRDAFLATARDIHAELAVPQEQHFANVGNLLDPAVLPEERAVLEQAGRWYVAMFGDRPAQWDDPGAELLTERHGIRFGGWIDLPLRTADGGFELRQFELWGRRTPPADPFDVDAIRLAFLRLKRWLNGEPLRAVWADLLQGVLVERVIESSERAVQIGWFDERLEIVARRSEEGIAKNDRYCGGCAVVSRCPEHEKGALWGSAPICCRGSSMSHQPGSIPGAGVLANGEINFSSFRRATSTPAACTASSCTTHCT